MSQTAIILTGAAGGVGQDACLTLAQKGYYVYAGAIDPWEMELLTKMQQDNAALHIQPVMLDMRDHSHIAAVVKDVEAKGFRLSGLVLNGAAAPEGVPAEHTPPELLRDVLESNVIGGFAAVRACLDLLKRDAGRIVFLCSATIFAPPPLVLPYVTSKCAIAAMAHSLRRELRNTRVKVTLLIPGVIKNTYMSHGLFMVTKARLAKIRGVTPESISAKSYDPGKNTALMQPEGGADPFYEGMLNGQFKLMDTALMTGFMPALVTKYIVKSLEDAEPKPAYVIGLGSHIFNIMNWLFPYSWMDKITVAMGYK